MSNTRAAASEPLSTPGLRATTIASPMRSAPTTAWVVTSISRSPRSSASAAATSRLRSGFDETIWLLAQAEGLLGEAEEVCLLASNASLLAGRLDDAPVDNPPPEVAAVDRQPEHRFVDMLELGDREL